jgi:uncharacterized protein (TIGR02996 family)
MSTGQALLQAILADPEDDTPRLVYADWLGETGDEDRAEFIRLQVERARLPEQEGRAKSLWVRERTLLHEHRDRWLAGLEPLLARGPYDVGVGFERGFVHSIELPVQWLLEHGDLVRQHCPLLRRAEVYRLTGWGKRLAESPVLRGLRELAFPCWMNEEDAFALARSPHLGELRVLEVWLGSTGVADDVLGRTLARAPAWPRLRELRALDVDEVDRSAWVALVDEVAGRPLARYHNPNQWYNFETDFSTYYFPGRLPDGRQVFVALPGRKDPTLRMLVFDAGGNQLEERHVTLPAEIYDKPDDVYKVLNRAMVKQILRDTLGFEDAAIRVRSLDFQSRSYVYRFPRHMEDAIGTPDDPEAIPEEREYPLGNGGRAAGWIEDGHFVFSTGGDGWYVNGRGEVEST